MVLDALEKNPPRKPRTEEVELPQEAGVYGHENVAAPSEESEEAPITPAEVMVTMLLVALPIPEMVCAEVDAVVADT
jgi:hypothetical protein